MQWFAPPFDLAATVPHTTGTVWVIPIFVLPGSFYFKVGPSAFELLFMDLIQGEIWQLVLFHGYLH